MSQKVEDNENDNGPTEFLWQILEAKFCIREVEMESLGNLGVLTSFGEHFRGRKQGDAKILFEPGDYVEAKEERD